MDQSPVVYESLIEHEYMSIGIKKTTSINDVYVVYNRCLIIYIQQRTNQQTILIVELNYLSNGRNISLFHSSAF